MLYAYFCIVLKFKSPFTVANTCGHRTNQHRPSVKTLTHEFFLNVYKSNSYLKENTAFTLQIHGRRSLLTLGIIRNQNTLWAERSNTECGGVALHALVNTVCWPRQMPALSERISSLKSLQSNWIHYARKSFRCPTERKTETGEGPGPWKLKKMQKKVWNETASYLETRNLSNDL